MLVLGNYPQRYRRFGNIVHWRIIDCVPIDDYTKADSVLKDIGTFDQIVFTSVNGTKYLLERLYTISKDARALSNAKIAAIEKAFEKYGKQVAAVIVEPVAGNMGAVLPKEGFLKTIRKYCTKNGGLLIFDEVITGFRVKYGSIQDIFGVKADLTYLGKIIGGGFPICACGGRAELMDNLSPQGAVYQAGTLSGNPACIASGIATLKLLRSQKPYQTLAKATEKLCERLSQALDEHNVKHTINRIASMFTLFFNPSPVTDYASAIKSDTEKYAKFSTKMLKAGIYLPPSQFEACFVSIEHRDRNFGKTITAVRKLAFRYL